VGQNLKMRNDNKSIKLLIKLLSETTSLAIVRNFLKDRKLTHTASSWDDMEKKRLIPLLKSKKIHINDLVVLLRDAEEHGHQHVYLYRCTEKDAATIMGHTRINSIANNNGLINMRLLQKPPTFIAKP
jgi:hypothetical protein